MFKDKILAAFKAKFPGVNLSKTRLNAIAAKIEAKVIDDETKIDAALDELNTSGINTFAEIAKEDDRIRGIEAKSKQPATPPKDDKSDPPKPSDVPDDAPSWFKSYADSQKAYQTSLEQKLTNLESAKTQETLAQQRATRLKDVPEFVYKRIPIPKTNEELDTQVAEILADHAVYHQTLVDQGLSIKPPVNGAPAPDPNKKVSADVASFMAKQAKETAVLNPQQVTK